jgi:acetolactate synthase small subunit
VLHATDHTDEIVVERELALIKLAYKSGQRTDILQICEHFKCETVDLSESTVTVQVTGKSEKLDALLLMLNKFNIIEMVRTGKILVARGEHET